MKYLHKLKEEIEKQMRSYSEGIESKILNAIIIGQEKGLITPSYDPFVDKRYGDGKYRYNTDYTCGGDPVGNMYTFPLFVFYDTLLNKPIFSLWNNLDMSIEIIWHETDDVQDIITKRIGF